ncbi:hypothetical protein TNIN_390211 [Trichonephila inaurata madagascariensis]|uniref:Uncharacterized protein n=1 Tax=Trichonephila inaurata madagascariensis TaxID=2747483 RepID=A0A8X7BZA7_9ARAC|nr:hypothetical protein TNIN_390211 [Trichonephila inaurata madagascariensis]
MVQFSEHLIFLRKYSPSWSSSNSVSSVISTLFVLNGSKKSIPNLALILSPEPKSKSTSLRHLLFPSLPPYLEEKGHKKWFSAIPMHSETISRTVSLPG